MRIFKLHRPEFIVLAFFLLVISVVGAWRFVSQGSNSTSPSFFDGAIAPFHHSSRESSVTHNRRGGFAIDGSTGNGMNDPAHQLIASNGQGRKVDGSALVYVDIQGAVVRPGVYHVSAQQRVEAVIIMAGGLAKGSDPSGVNAAALIQDGERIYVPFQTTRGNGHDVNADALSAGTAVSSASATGGKGVQFLGRPVDINRATAAELQQLPGIGPKRAEQVIQYRTVHGLFQSIDDLAHVKGFGSKRLAVLRPLIVVQ